MKILFLTTQTLAGSTVVGRVLPLAKELAQKHEVHITVHHSEKIPSQPNTDKVRVHVLGNEPFARSEEGKKHYSAVKTAWIMKINATRKAWLVLKEKPDACIVIKPLPENALAVLFFSYLARTKIVLDVDDFELTANKLTSILQRAAIHWAERFCARRASHIVAASPFLQDHFRQLTAEKKPVALIPTGLTFEAAVTNPAPFPTLLYVGSISRTSGHRVDLLPAILKQVRAKNPAARLIMTGSGDDISILQEEFEKQGLREYVEWYGRFSIADLPSILAKTTIILDPIDASIANRAKSSFRVMLAVAAGLPVVTSDIGIRPMLIPEVLHDRLFATPEDPASYAAIITALLDSPLDEATRNNMTAHATRFSWQNLSKQYTAIITS